MQEVKLWTNKKEKDQVESLADLYAIIKTTEKLERAYIKDTITAKEYESSCQKLIAQFRTLHSSMKDTVPNVDQFMAQYRLQCPLAATRLIRSGLPATLEHKTRQDGGVMGAVADTVQHFITAMDSLKLEMKAVDELCPILADLLRSMGKVPFLPPDFSAIMKIKNWYTKLYTMAASYELSLEESRQLAFDLNSSYDEFNAATKST